MSKAHKVAVELLTLGKLEKGNHTRKGNYTHGTADGGPGRQTNEST